MSKAWEGASDIFTDYEGTVTDAQFEVGQYGTQMKLTFDEIDGRDEGVFEFYSIPDSWETNDGGQTIERVDGKDRGSNPLKKSNAWQRFVVAAVKASNGEIVDLLGDDAPFTANAWIGTRWRMEAVEGKTYKDRETGESRKAKDKNYPVEFMGKDDGVKAAGSNGASGGSVDLSVLTDLHNPVLESQIVDNAKTMDYQTWFGASYAAITGAGVKPADIPDLLNEMSVPKRLYVKLGGKG